MGLKGDIYKAFEKNLGKDFVDATSEGKKKVDDLAEDISKAIINWVKAQTFNITEMEAPIHFPATTIKTKVIGGVSGPTPGFGSPIAGPALVGPADGQNLTSIKNIAQISDTTNKIQDGRVKSAVRNSKVKLLTSDKD